MARTAGITKSIIDSAISAALERGLPVLEIRATRDEVYIRTSGEPTAPHIDDSNLITDNRQPKQWPESD